MENYSFQRVFISPSAIRNSYYYMHKFVDIEGNFLKACFVKTILLSVVVDVNGHTTLKAWAIVESLNKESRTWFLRHLL